MLALHHFEYFFCSFRLELLSLTRELVCKTRPWAERRLALCIFDDLVEVGGEKSVVYWDHFIPFLLDYALDPNPEVRQMACYGLGVCAQEGRDHFEPVVKKALESLVSVISQPDSREEQNVTATENAISSVGKILQFQWLKLGDDVPNLMRMWVNWLPLKEDEVEAQVVHEQLISFVTSNHPHIFGKDFVNLPKIMSLFAFLLQDKGGHLVKDQAAVYNLLVQMRQQMPTKLLDDILMVLPTEERALLSRM
eukprot:TRINITY_DN4345_c0_g1_i9.p1 TRINITY_DN4345_c0_g1~~TRINITY_DN4345_c0_g1_i9.p1  ORF type:complete len:251 (+),score=76.36 TRINITY_DN4345_c0_g1_i9:275-1027(+)